MSECDGYRAGVPCWVAAVLLDPEKAVAFYTELFDWEARETMGLTHPKSTSSAPFVAATSPRSARSAAGRAVRAPVAHLHPGGERRLHHRQGEKSGRERGHETVGLARRRPRGGGLQSGGTEFGVWQQGKHKGAGIVNEPGARGCGLLCP